MDVEPTQIIYEAFFDSNGALNQQTAPLVLYHCPDCRCRMTPVKSRGCHPVVPAVDFGVPDGIPGTPGLSAEMAGKLQRFHDDRSVQEAAVDDTVPVMPSVIFPSHPIEYGGIYFPGYSVDQKKDALGRNLIIRYDQYQSHLESSVIVYMKQQRRSPYPTDGELVLSLVAASVAEFAWIDKNYVGLASVVRWHLPPNIGPLLSHFPRLYQRTPYHPHVACYYGTCNHIFEAPGLHDVYCSDGYYHHVMPARLLSWRFDVQYDPSLALKVYKRRLAWSESPYCKKQRI